MTTYCLLLLLWITPRRSAPLYLYYMAFRGLSTIDIRIANCFYFVNKQLYTGKSMFFERVFLGLKRPVLFLGSFSQNRTKQGYCMFWGVARSEGRGLFYGMFCYFLLLETYFLFFFINK